MTPNIQFTDIHCHLLPGLDDGAADLDKSLAMAEMAVAEGIETIVATPHQLGNYPNNSGDIIRAAVRDFQNRLDQRRIPLRVLPGGDVRIEPGMIDKIRRGEVATLGDHRRHILLELPHEVYFPIDRLLGELASAGLTGILSHPERNQGIINQPAVIKPLIERGCLMQVTAGSLTGDFGPQVKKLAESFVSQGLVHFIATDAHGTRRRPPLMQEPFHCVSKLVGEKVALELCCRNPKSAANNQAVSNKIHPPIKKTSFRWFRRTFATEAEPTVPI